MKTYILYVALFLVNFTFSQTDNNKINRELIKVAKLMNIGLEDYDIIKLKIKIISDLTKDPNQSKEQKTKKNIREKLTKEFESIKEYLTSIKNRYVTIDEYLSLAITESRRLNCNKTTSTLGNAKSDIFVLTIKTEDAERNIVKLLNTTNNSEDSNPITIFADILVANYTTHVTFLNSFKQLSKFNCKEVKESNINLDEFATSVFEACGKATLIKSYKEAKRAEENIFIDFIFDIYRQRKKYPLLRSLIKKKYPNKDEFSADQLYVGIVLDKTISECKKAQNLIFEKMGNMPENQDLIKLKDAIKVTVKDYKKYESLSDYEKEQASFKLRSLVRNYNSSNYVRNKVIAYLLVNSAEYREYRTREVAALKIKQMKNGWYTYID